MNSAVERVVDEARSAWRFRWTGMLAAFAIAALGWSVVLSLPDRYEANASIFVDTRTALQPLLEGLTAGQDVNVQLAYVRQSLLTGDLLHKIAREAGIVGEGESDPQELAGTLENFGQRVVLEARSASGNSRDSAGSIYSFSYQDTNRERSLKVVDTVLNNFVEQTLGGKRRGSENAQRFLEEQLRVLELRLGEAEQRLAEFKKKNIGMMPNDRGDYFTQLQNELDRARQVENDLDVAQSRRAELARQLRGDAIVAASSNVATGATSATLVRIQEEQARLDSLLLRFTERHPDVITARATLAELNRRRESEIESLRRGDAAAVASSGVSSNPVYQSIQLQLNQADVDITALRGQLAQHQQKAAELQQRVDTAPKVEAEFAALNREYDVDKARYTALLSNLEKARLGEEADTAGSVRFEVVQPVTAPFVPVSPPRSLLLAGVLVGALALGAALAWLLHSFNPVVGSMRGLAALVDVPILGIVSPAFPHVLRVQKRYELFRLLGAAAGLVAVFIFVVVVSQNGFRLGAGAGAA
jgi:polysaccharide chain length determinant protein (PEP-CTERM system associated)